VVRCKKKVENHCSKEKVHLLTCALASWSIHKSATFFDVTDYLVDKATNLKKEKGILAQVPNYQTKTTLSE